VFDRVTYLVKKVVDAKIFTQSRQDPPSTQNFVMDVYIDIAPNHKPYVQDISPYLPHCARVSGLLFDWDYLEALDAESCEPEFRTLDSETGVQL